MKIVKVFPYLLVAREISPFQLLELQLRCIYLQKHSLDSRQASPSDLSVGIVNSFELKLLTVFAKVSL